MFDIFNATEEEAPQEDSVYPGEKSPARRDLYVVSVGGSLIVRGKPDSAALQKTANAISGLHDAGKKFVLVVGGGNTARHYVEAFGSVNNFEKDIMGIKITRANALLLASYISNAHNRVLTDIAEAKQILDSGKIPVYGGLMPFFTTDAVAALLAEYLEGSFVNLTNVDGIYDADPKEDSSARRFDEISYSRLVRLVSEQGSSPGQNLVLDLACCMILQRSSIPGVVLDGNDTENFSNYVKGYSFTGTVIRENVAEEIESGEIEEYMGRKKPKKKGRRKTRKGIRFYRDDEPFSEKDIDNLKL